MRAEYDSKANVVSIALTGVSRAQRADQVHPRAIVALDGGAPVELQLLYPDLGLDEPIGALAGAYALDDEALVAAARAALAAPDRSITLDVAVRSVA